MKVVVSNFNPKTKTVDRHGNFKSGGFELSVRNFEKVGKAFYDKSEGSIKKYSEITGATFNPFWKDEVYKLNHALCPDSLPVAILKRKIRGQFFFFALFREGCSEIVHTLYRIPESGISMD